MSPESSPALSSPQSAARNAVDVWFAILGDLISQKNAFAGVLNLDETKRAQRFKFQNDRDQYVLCRGLLRELLSRYTGTQPEQLDFCYGKRGKPSLVEQRGIGRLTFNLSHAHGAVIYAVTRDCEVGVDLESSLMAHDDQALVEQYLSDREAAALGKLPADQRLKVFLKCWTRKEAYVKGKGQGVLLDLRNFDVFDPADSEPRLRVASDSNEAERWTLMDLDVPDGYVAALAVEGRGPGVSIHRWPEDVANFSFR